MAKRIKSGAVAGGYKHPGVYRKLLREQCYAHVYESGLYKSEPDPIARVCPDPRLRLDPKSAHLFKDGDTWVDELFAERLAAAAKWVHVVRASEPGANDGIITSMRDPVPHPMFEDRKARFVVTPDDIITPAEDDD